MKRLILFGCGASPTAPEVKPENSTQSKAARLREYEKLFFKESSFTARNGKTVYIRKEFHDRIMRIIQTIGSNETSLSCYIDNVLAEHFAEYRQDISDLYKERSSNDIF